MDRAELAAHLVEADETRRDALLEDFVGALDIQLAYGTSMAAPLVAATAALIHAQYPKTENAKIVDHIQKTGKRIDGPVQSRLDAGNALRTNPR